MTTVESDPSGARTEAPASGGAAARGPRSVDRRVLGAALLGAAVGAGLVWAMAQASERRGRGMRPLARRVRRSVAGYAGAARDAIDEAVTSELEDLRRSIRRRRKRLGI